MAVARSWRGSLGLNWLPIWDRLQPRREMQAIHSSSVTNNTTGVLRILSTDCWDYDIECDALHPGTKFDLIVERDFASAKYYFAQSCDCWEPCFDHNHGRLYHDDVYYSEEISINCGPCGRETWEVVKRRPRIHHQEYDADEAAMKSKEYGAYKALKSEASARMKRVLSRKGKLESHLSTIKIGHAQCKHLVQTFSKGIQEMRDNYTKVFEIEENIVSLYNSKKLRNLVNCLDRLENCVCYSEKFLQECSRKWKFLALQISAPFCSPATTTQSKFDLLIGELSWNLDKIRYVLYLPWGTSSMVEWKWCSIQCRQVLRGAGGIVDHKCGGGSRANMDDDRVNLKFLLEDGSNFEQDQSHTNFILWMFVLIQNRIRLNPWTCFIIVLIGFLIMNKLWIFVSIQSPIRLLWMWFILMLIQSLIALWTWFFEDESREYFRAFLKQRLATENMSISSTSNSSSISVLTAFRIDLSHLKFHTEIGGGGFKRIYSGEWLGLKVAIAIIKVPRLDSGQSFVENEARHLADLQHPNIVAFYGYEYTCSPKLPTSYCRINESPPKAVCYLVMELMEEDLSRTIRNRTKSVGHFSMPVAIDIMLQIAEAMVHLHEQGIMHRDLKPMNCLVKARSPPLSSNQDVYYDIKLTDFGSAKEMVVLDNTPNPGTTSWMAPEMLGPSIAGRIPYTKSGDVYGFAMICYQVITMEETPKLPERFPSYPRVALIEAVRNGVRPEFPPELSCPEGLKKLITDCWVGLPDARPNFKEIRRRLWDLKRVVEVGDI